VKSHATPIGRQAFTLVELLVVISIIGLLSTIAVVSLSSARSKARDTKRQADARQILTAMQLYYNDNGAYPNPQALGCNCGYSPTVDACCLGHGSSGTCFAGLLEGCTALDNALAPYMAKIPDDPENLTSGYGDAYIYCDPNMATGCGIPGPALQWGYDQVSNSTNCLGGSFGQWGAGIGRSRYWCARRLEP
jgi:prepilin-type N-terminal cleavage/methylation domain-containing protein